MRRIRPTLDALSRLLSSAIGVRGVRKAALEEPWLLVREYPLTLGRIPDSNIFFR